MQKLKEKKSLGRVHDLECHVDSEWWKKIFNSNYLKTDADVVNNQTITSNEVDIFINALKMNKEDNILDLCCGQGRHLIELGLRGYKKLNGLDRSRYLIQRGKINSKKHNIFIKFREGDARKINSSIDSFDFVLMLGNSFGYFDSMQDDIRVLNEILRVLKPGGQIFIDVADGTFLKENFQPYTWEWIDKHMFVCRERELSKDKQRLIMREIISDIDKGIISDQFYAERLYDRNELIDILKKVGFVKINVHGEIYSKTDKTQDLGMMEQRLMISGRAKKEWAKIIKSKKKLKNIVVLLGDPGKKDIVKPNSTFDEDDYYTIDKLKSALTEMKDYNFKFLNNHDTLMQDLIKMKNDIYMVFNLCDEGYYNDPTKELHVTSILDILNIPYTGSGPQCLAYCYDKSLIRGIAKEMNIPVPEAFFIKPEDDIFSLSLNFPVIIKPNFGDSSFGITQRSVVFSPEELINAVTEIREKFGYDKPVLVEEFLKGSDLTIGIIGNRMYSYKIFPMGEEDYSDIPSTLPKICGYEAKWDPTSPYWKIKTVRAQLSKKIENLIYDYSLALFERLEVKDYCRFDWRLDKEGYPKLLEVNPNPGWCWDGHLAKMAAFDHISYKEMLNSILMVAEERLNLKS